jgi:hypothetical protein
MSKKWFLGAFLSVAVAAGGFVAAKNFAAWPKEYGTASQSNGFYQCSMHPEVVSDKPGICPICQMELQHVEGSSLSPAGNPMQERRIVFYRHPMRPDVTSPNPAKDEMGMSYVPVYDDELGAETGSVSGHAPFSLSPERQQLIGVTRAKVETRPLAIVIRAVGRVAYDPALYQTIIEYREALKSSARVKDSPWPEAREGSEAIIRSAALKLRQQGLSASQIAQIAKEKGDPTNLLLPDKAIWVYAQVYEYEAPLVRAGESVEVTVPSLPGQVFNAKIGAIDPILNPTTRTVRVRILVPTPDENLRPESFVHVKIHVPIGDKLALPADAVLDTGEQKFVFVIRGEGQFEPRSVSLGREVPGYYEVLSGLEAGDEVVTSANFLIDSESRFRSALAAFKKKPQAAPPQ